jgi:hypothetical protein
MRRTAFLAFTLYLIASGCSNQEPGLDKKVPAPTPAQDLKTRWNVFASKGPEYSMPIRRCFVEEGIPSFDGSLYVGLYPKESFIDLVDFNLYQWYSSSIQQDLFATGKIHYSSFFPESVEDGTSKFERQLGALLKRKNVGDVREFLRGLGMPKEAQWVQELDFEEWEWTTRKDGLELTASTKQGYLTMIVVK